MGIGMISTYPPRMCGLATVAWNLRQALVAAGEPDVPVVAMVKDPGDAAYGPEVLVPVQHHQRRDYVTAAEALNAAPVDAVILQHEFGIFGGSGGSYILQLLAALRKPVITVFHSVPKQAPKVLVTSLRAVAARSARIVTLSHRDRNLLCTRYGLPGNRVEWIPLGVPEAPAGTPDEWKARLGISDRTVAMTFGLLGPGKGLETAIEAVGRVAPTHPNLLYLIVGVTHPEAKRSAGESYRTQLMAQTSQLGIANQVQFIDRYLDEVDLLRYLLAADIYVTPYPQKARGISLTTLYAASMGKAILTTPFDYAQELLANGASLMVPFRDANAMSQALQVLISSPETRRALGTAAQARTQDCTWSRIADRYLAVARALGAGAKTPARRIPAASPDLNAELSADRSTIRAHAGRPTSFRLVIANTGRAPWSPQEHDIGIAGDLLSPSGRLLRPEFWRCPVTAEVPAGGERAVQVHFLAPVRPGPYLVEIYPVHRQLGRFGAPLRIKLAVGVTRRSI